MFFRFVTSGEIKRRSEFFEPFILGMTNATATVEQVYSVSKSCMVIAINIFHLSMVDHYSIGIQIVSCLCYDN